jgi:acetyl-CoA carboxylase biotin carboxyl carrier protein
VGTYYESPSPGSPPFVKPGDVVEAGQILCIVEAMKLMNEIEADVAGEIVKSLVKNGQPIEYGQDLFTIRPKK